MKVPEYAKIKGVHERTVYRWIEKGDINARTVDGVLHVEVDEDGDNDNDIVAMLKSENSQLREDIEYLQRGLEKAQETIEAMSEERQKAQERSDTIIMQLTKQLESQTLLLEDMRDRSLWKRVKTALGFASS